MIGTITPLVKVARRDWGRTSGLFLGGALAGSALTGLVLGSVGEWLRSLPAGQALSAVRGPLLIVVMLLVAARELGVWRVALIERRRSVPRYWWSQMGRNRAALAYGFGLGLGFATHLGVATYYIPVAWTILYGTPATGLLVFLAYGLGRTAAVVSSAAPVNSSDDPFLRTASLRQMILERQHLIHTVNGLAASFLAIIWAFVTLIALRGSGVAG